MTASTDTQKTLMGSGSDAFVVRHIHITADASSAEQTTDLVIFDNSAFGANTARGRVLALKAWGAECTVQLLWDQSTDSSVGKYAVNIDPMCINFAALGSLTARNPNGSGATGDLLLTTTGIGNGDELDVIIVIGQD